MNPYRFESRMDPMTRNETAAWEKVEQSFRAEKMVAPRKGFANRWMHIQRKDQLLERNRREAWLAFGNVAAILAILAVITLTVWPVIVLPSSLLSAIADTVLDFLTFLLVIADISISFFQAFSLFAWFAAALGFFGLVAVWASLFSRVTVGNR